MDTLSFYGLSIRNCSLLSDAMKISRFQKLVFGSQDYQQIVFENIGVFIDSFFYILLIADVEINNIKIQNVASPLSRSHSFFLLNNLPFAPTKIQNIEVTGYNFLNGGFLSTITSLDRIQVSNIVIQDSYTKPGILIFSINRIKSLVFTNFTVRNTQVIQTSDELSTILRVNALDLQSNLNSTFENIDLSNCGISFMKFGSLINNNSVTSQLELKNITIRNSVYTSSRSIISTENLENDADFVFKINGFTSSNVTFIRTGNLMLFDHSLMHPVVIQNSVFNSLKSVALSVVSSGLLGALENKVSFQNCTFNNMFSSSQSLIRVSEKSTAEFIDSKFDSISISFDRSGIIEASSNSIIRFTHTNFTNNAAVASTLFTVSSGAYVECNSCLIVNNFGISNTVVSVSSNGFFKFFASDIYGNIGIQTPIGKIFDASQRSIIDH